MGRSLGGMAGCLGLALLVVPVLALVPAMVVDRGVDGSARLSAFPAALVVLDPLVWRCVRNSGAVALAVTVGALGLGTGLGVMLGRRRFWGRRVLGFLAVVPVAVSPIWIAPGVVAWIGGESSWAWLAARSFLGQPGDDWARWFALAWTGLAGATPLVILATLRGLSRVDPAWADAARVVGAGRWRVWRDVTWPTIRPELGRVGGAIFTGLLVEPAAPTILGLRRTLAVELTDAAFRFDEPNRAATLAAIAVVLAVAARSLFARWGGPAHGGSPTIELPNPPAPRAGFRLGGFAAGVLVIWALITLGPVGTVARRLGGAALGGHPLGWATLRLILAESTSDQVLAWIANSAVTASLAVGLASTLLALFPLGSRLGRGLAAVPPLALAVGALAVPSLLATWADVTSLPGLASSLRAVRVELSPGRSPSILLVLVLAATRLVALGRGRESAEVAPLTARADAALLAGASARAAHRLARGASRGSALRPALIAWTWAGTDLASVWVLTALDERRTIAAAALDLLGSGTGPLDPRLLGLFVAMTIVRLGGLTLLLGRGRRLGWTSVL